MEVGSEHLHSENPLQKSDYLHFCKLLLSKIAEEAHGDKNIFVSPFSIFSVLHLLADISADKTRDEIFSLINCEQNFECQISKKPISELLRDIQSKSKNTQFSNTNALVVDEKFSNIINDKSIHDLLARYDAEVFINKNGARELNQWFTAKTDELIGTGDFVNPMNGFSLINAVCFLANWKKKYNSNDIHENEIFTNRDGLKEEVTLLCSIEPGFVHENGFIGFTKPYEGDLFDFMALLPEDKNACIEELLLKEDVADLQNIYLNRRNAIINAKIPEFKLEKEYDIGNLLKNLGARRMFLLDANFFINSSVPGAHVENIMHKAVVTVDRNGTKAAAVTQAMFVTGMCFGVEEIQSMDITLNRPFAFSIMHRETGLPIFIGIVNSVGHRMEEYDTEWIVYSTGGKIEELRKPYLCIIQIQDCFKEKIDRHFTGSNNANHILCYAYKDTIKGMALEVLCRVEMLKHARVKLYDGNNSVSVKLYYEDYCRADKIYDGFENEEEITNRFAEKISKL